MKKKQKLFIESFNTLHSVIQERVGGKNDNFKDLVDKAVNKNDNLVIRHKTKIEFYRKFRNLLVHESYLI